MVGNCGDVTLAFFPLFFLQIVDILAVACHTQTVSSDFPSAQTKDSTLRQSYAALNLMLCTVSLRRAKQAYKRAWMCSWLISWERESAELVRTLCDAG